MNIKKKKRQIAENRVSYLVTEVEKSLKDNHNLAEIQAKQAREFSKKFNIKSGFSQRMLFCHKCKRFIVPGFNSRIRLSKIRKSVNITCLCCGFTYRKMINKSQTYI